ncbi:DUF3800 domain-containing protein [Schinkia azotoformans]|uniref:DUF3800 domain-containing protein n=1 Tax=Schinkia azotoformans TaxID=1454 RepID=UPI002DBB1422|nr:DUF3800 domain-containing protein [Schinkia azotoformans]MEC1771974.1 DUF3800 domain-containing protein [Schinkia azotoformans]MED4366472.1 DUF3800 domain-containing protein [Schinkia azotoformans]
MPTDKAIASPIHVQIFYDESGKQSEKVHFMGAILIPDRIYKHKNRYEELNTLISEGTKPLHFTDYNGYANSPERFKKLVSLALENIDGMQLNVINYDINKIESIAQPIKPVLKDIVPITIYNKFPERLVYGLLRKYGQHAYLSASIHIEEDSTYSKGSKTGNNNNSSAITSKDLADTMLYQLNIQAVYRNESYRVESVDFLTKRVEYGIELTDTLLGIIRYIIENNYGESTRILAKRQLILELLETTNLKTFLINNTSYYEWNQNNQLTAISFSTYLNLFLSSHG